MSTPRTSRLPWPAMFESTTASMTGTATRTVGARLDRLEHLLVEAGLAGRDLQLGLAGDAIDRAGRTRTSTLWFAVCMPTNTATPSTMPAVVSSVRRTCLRKYGQLIRRSRITRCHAGASRSHVLDDAAVAERDRAAAARGDLHVVRDDDDRRAEARVQIANQRRISSPVLVSRLPVGSSASRIGG